MTLTKVFGVGLVAVVALAAIVVGHNMFPIDGAAGNAFGGIALALTALPAALPRDVVSLKQLRATAYAEMEAALQMADTEERQQEFDGAAANVERIDAELVNAEKLQRLKGNNARGTPESENPAAEDAVPQPFMAKYRNLPAAYHEVLPGKALSAAQSAALGDLLMCVMRASTRHQVDPRLIEASLGSNETVEADGGFLVEKDVADGLLRRTFAISRISSRVRRIPISAKSNGLKINALKDDSRATGSRWGGIQSYWIGEGDSLTPTRPKFRQMRMELKKLAGLLYATNEMLMDSTALAAVIGEAFPEEFSFMVDDAVFEGPGTAQPLGFMKANCKVTVSKETGQPAKTIQFENITNMWARCPARSMATAEWWINQDVLPQLMGMSMVIGTGGVPVYLPPGGLSGSPYGTLMSRPVIPIEYCETLGTEGDIVLADPAQYVMIDKGDIQYATSIHVAFLTDEQAFRFIYRVDGQPVDDKPITPFKGTNKQSTFVTLQTR
jgi:HK97 family phage major capsid protein